MVVQCFRLSLIQLEPFSFPQQALRIGGHEYVISVGKDIRTTPRPVRVVPKSSEDNDLPSGSNSLSLEQAPEI